VLTSIRQRPRRLYSVEGLAAALRSTSVQARLLDPCVPATLYAPDTPTAITNLFTGRPARGIVWWRILTERLATSSGCCGVLAGRAASTSPCARPPRHGHFRRNRVASLL